MPTRPKLCAVIFANDASKLAVFYQAVAGLAEAGGDAHHTVLAGDGFELVLHGLPEAVAADIHITTPPQVREETPIKLCFPVNALADARDKAAQLGGWLAAPSQEWSGNGFRACDGYDPEGNVFQLREAASQLACPLLE